ncbi:MAG: Hpt domain-containing protein [Chloroflexota bacterium]|nr:MAG: Hpt domain-containing protein [Chloroflexota bacterium]
MADVASSSGNTLDSEALARLAKLGRLTDQNLLGDLVALFARDVPPRIAACQDALDRDDPESLRRGAHAIKGTAGALGARELGALCARIETEAGVATPGDVSGLVSALDSAFRRACAALEALSLEQGA